MEVGSEVRRGLTVLKTRGSRHESAIREFTIDGSGVTVGEPFVGLGGILTGQPLRHE